MDPGPAAPATRSAARRYGRLLRSRRVQLIVGALVVVAWVVARHQFSAGLPAASGSMSAGPASAWPIPGATLGNTRAGAWSGTWSLGALDASWQRQFDAPIVTEPVADDERLYLALADGTLEALSLKTGSIVWSITVQGQLDAAPTVAGDRLFIVLRRGAVVALSAERGETEWTRPSTYSFSTSPVVVDGIVYVQSHGEMLAFDAVTGDELWRHTFERTNAASTVTARPVVSRHYLAAMLNDRLVLFDRRSGAQTYAYPLRDPQYLAAADGYIVAMTPHRTVVLRDEQRSPWWEFARRGWGQLYILGMAPEPPHRARSWLVETPPGALPPVILGGDDGIGGDGGLVVFPSVDGALTARSLATGAVRWNVNLGTPVESALGADDMLLLAHRDGLSGVDARSGARLTDDVPGSPWGGTAEGSRGDVLIATSSAVVRVDSSGRVNTFSSASVTAAATVTSRRRRAARATSGM